MLDEFITRVSAALTLKGYLTDRHPRIPGVPELLYARSPGRFRLGFAKVEDHFLFVDWDNALFGQLDRLKQAHQLFRTVANQGFRTPHALRLQIPNLALVAVSRSDFPVEAIHFASTCDFTPRIGGEVGQAILVSLKTSQITSLVSLGSGRYPRPGALGLGHSARLIREVCGGAFDPAHRDN